MRRFIVITVVAMAAVFLLILGTGELDPIEAKEGKKGKTSGKVLYRNTCKPCHGPNSPNGEYSPLTLIQDQWDRFFDKKLVKTHADVEVPGQPGTKLLDLDPEIINKIRKFSVDHAADSESPMTCG